MRIHSCHAGTAAAVLVLLMSGRAAAQETILYYTTDAIGSVRMVTDSGGAVVARYDYRPFGDPCGTACGPQGSTERLQFTGSEKDTETTLDYLGARHYASGIGRFLSADIPGVDQHLRDPQSWGLYSYARNNPLRFVDPTGRTCVNSYDADSGTFCAQTIVISRPIEEFMYWVSRFGDWTSQAVSVMTLEERTFTPSLGEEDKEVIEPSPFQNPLLLAALVLRPGKGLARGAGSAILGRSPRALQKFFTKHGRDFGLRGNWNPSKANEASRAIHQHINSASVRAINGTYRGAPAIHHVDPKSGLNIISTPGGVFVSGWRLSSEQLQSVLSSGRLF